MESILLEKYIKTAEKAFEEKDFMEGMRLLEEALTIEPHFGKAYNHMGWLYLYHLNDWDKAESYLKLALKFSPKYSAPYIHLSYMLFEKGRFDELNELLKNALDVGGVQKSFIFNEYGQIDKARGKYSQAIRNYKTALQWSFNDQDITECKNHIKRCKKKRWIKWI